MEHVAHVSFTPQIERWRLQRIERIGGDVAARSETDTTRYTTYPAATIYLPCGKQLGDRIAAKPLSNSASCSSI